MAKKKADDKMPATTEEKTSQARIELPAHEMEQIRIAARSIGLSLSAFIRMAVLKEARRVKEGRD